MCTQVKVITDAKADAAVPKADIFFEYGASDDNITGRGDSKWWDLLQILLEGFSY